MIYCFPRWLFAVMAVSTLYLEDGSAYTGRSFGATKDVTGEVGKAFSMYFIVVTYSLFLV